MVVGMTNIRVFSRYIPVEIVLLAMAEFAGSYAALYAGLHLRFMSDIDAIYGDAGHLYPEALIFAVFTSLALVMTGLYRSRQRPSSSDVVIRVIVAATLSSAAITIVFYVYPPLFIGRGALAFVALATVLFLLTLRYLFFAHFDGALFRRRVLVLGAGRQATKIARLRRKSDQRSFRIVGFVPAGGEATSAECQDRLACPDDLVKFVEREHINEVVVAFDDCRIQYPEEALMKCRLAGVCISEITSFIERETGRVDIDLIRPSWLVFQSGFHVGFYESVAKRLADFVLSLTILVVMTPILLLTVIAIYLEDGRRCGIIYRQRRVGYLGKEFTILKFRSMRNDSESERGATWATADDPRVTLVGRIIRRLRIDELPQLINILTGEMSFVGTRPERPEFVKMLRKKIPYYDGRNCVKPGLTGWAQVCYRYGASVQDARMKLEYDLYYVKHASLMFDLLIALQTVDVVLWQRGMAMSLTRAKRRTSNSGVTIRDSVDVEFSAAALVRSDKEVGGTASPGFRRRVS